MGLDKRRMAAQDRRRVPISSGAATSAADRRQCDPRFSACPCRVVRHVCRDDYAAYVRYCFEDPLDAEIFRARFEPKIERFKLAG